MTKSRKIAINGILIALTIVMSVTMLVTGGMAFLPLTVLVVGSVLMGKWTAIILGFTFGLVSFVSAYIFPSASAPFFQNPLVSLLPRILSAILAYCVFKLSQFAISKLDKKLKKPLNEYVAKSISTALGAIFVVFFNTLLVLAMIWILFNGKTMGSVFVNKEFVMGLITINFVVEIIVTPILSMPVAFATEKFLKKNTKQIVTDKDIEDFDKTILDNKDDSFLDIKSQVENVDCNDDIDNTNTINDLKG